MIKSGTITVLGKELAYLESPGEGAPIVFVHGNSSSKRSFLKQLESSTAKTHRMIAIDLPGHGESARANQPETDYSLPGYADCLRECALHLGASDAIFVGWSLGGHVVLEASSQLHEARGFLIFGTPPLAFPPDMAHAFRPNPAMAYSFKEALSESEMEGYVRTFFVPGMAELPGGFLDDIRRTDGQCRACLGASIRPGGYQDEVRIVAQLTQPLAVLHGLEEQLISGAYFASLEMPTLWRREVQMIPNAGHAPHWEQPELFNGLLSAFVAQCAGGSGA